MKKTKLIAIAATLLAMSLAVGCGGNQKAADTTKAGTGKASGEVMIYTSIYPDIIDNMCKPNLKKAFPNMKVNWFQGGTEQVITKITGEITSEGSVKIGQSSVVIGNITANSAVIAGAVKGDIDVRGPVILDTSAIVMGNIKSKSVQINNGAVIEGLCSQCYADVNPTAFFEDIKKKNGKK